MDLLVTLGAVAARRATNPRHSHRVHLDLDRASVGDLAAYAGEEPHSITVIVSSWAALRRAVIPLRLIGAAKDLRVRVLDEVAPAGFSAGVWPVTQGRRLELTCQSVAGSGTTIHLRLSRPAAAHQLIGPLIQSKPSILTPPLRLALTHRDVEPFVIGNPTVTYAGVDDVVNAGGVSVPQSEAVVSPSDADHAPGLSAGPDGDPRLHVVVASPSRPLPSRSGSSAALLLPPVDIAVVNPVGFFNHAVGGAAHVTMSTEGTGEIVDSDHQPLLLIEPHAALTHGGLARLRDCRYLAWDQGAGATDEGRAEAALLCQLAAAGVPLVAPLLSRHTRALLGDDLANAIDDQRPEDMDDPLLREAASIRLRRAALRRHGTGPRLRQLARLVGHSVADEPAVSIILMTKRPHRVRLAVEQVRRQTYRKAELILGLHGDGFDEALVARSLRELTIPSVTVRVPASSSFGEALNVATDRCGGRLVTKFDDDDVYGTEHIWDLVLAADYSGADLVGKAAEFTVVTAADTTVRRHSRHSERFTRHVAGGTFLLRRDTLQAMGGWRPQPRYVDDSLLRQVRSYGGTVYRTHGFGYLLVRHDDGHTWDVAPDYFLAGDTRRWPTASPLQQVALEQTWTPSPGASAPGFPERR